MPVPPFSLRAARIFTRDFDPAYEFYWEIMGLEVLMRNREAGFALFDTGGTRLILEAVDGTDPAEREIGRAHV